MHAEGANPGYGEIFRSVNPVRLMTLGLPALIGRNALLSLAFVPRIYGNSDSAFDSLAITGAIALSHPLEVARVLVVNGASQSNDLFGNMAATLRSIYQNEGVAGMYRGLTPRFVFLFPTMLTFTEVLFPGQTLLARFRSTQSAPDMSGSLAQPIV